MKIAFVGQKGVPTLFGGVEKHVEELGSRLVERGHEVIVYTGKSYNDFNGYYKGMRIISIPCIASKNLEMPSRTSASLLHLFGKDVDVVHIHNVESAVLWFIPRMHAKVAVTSHGQGYRREKFSPMVKRLLKFTERVFAYVPVTKIAVSKTLQRYYLEQYGCETVYIPNGVVIRESRDRTNMEKFGLEKDGYILFVGRIIPTKGCNFLIEAFKKITTDKKLVIVGGSAFTDTYLNKLKQSANKNTIFLGYKYGDELYTLYCNAYCCVVPSEIEGLAVTLLEAMSFGKCVIYSDIPENVEVAEGVGISFRNRNIDDLASKLQLALTHQNLCAELGEKAKERVKNDYNWEKIVDQTEEIYHSLFK